MTGLLGQLKVAHRLWLNIGMALFAIAVVLVIVLLQFRDSQMAARQLETRELVETAFGVIEHHGRLADRGVMAIDDAKARAAEVVSSLRYGTDGYYWINDTNAVMVMHPHKPELNGKSLADRRDPNGILPFREIVDAARSSAEGGFVHYSWPKPGLDEAAPKVSFGKLYGPWNWIVGTGLYVDDIDAAFWHRAMVLSGVVAGIGILLVIVATLVQRSIMAPVRKLQHAVCVVAKEGNLAVRADIRQGGELGEMGHHFDGMMDLLQRFVSEVRDAVGQLASASTELASITEQTETSAKTQRGQTTQIATAMTEMSATVNEIAANAASTAEATRDADNQAAGGTGVVNEATRSITQLADGIQHAGGVIRQLEQDSLSIGKVLEVIQGIAEQTNLLALNAAIEAARAGEQGRGFAVVADEVRGLAGRTQESTSEIQEMIQTLQSRTQEAVAAMESGREQATSSVGRAQDAVTSLGSITESVARIKDMSMQIATASEEQTAVAEEVNASMVQIDSIAAETIVGASEIAASSRSLAELAERLRAVSMQFHG